ncbi:DegQ family serine endoprotease [Lysobacter sp. TY2-98]|uniref:DegQ family serine endoprotease n=1 Tax=Lysobacter sp. TY2-98 TaxID=2290922 RepID=UPI000E1FBC45|nr:DegQ family serine endoprotease [Lysobacter sp. TY2-98]AXK72306.1 DegQ family serine endoprotease [Lysobacter sp. TY2-98]
MNRPLQTLALVAAVALALPAACTAQQPQNAAALPVPSTAPPAVQMVSGLPDFTNLVQQVGPAVVNVSAEIRGSQNRRLADEDDEIPEFFKRFFGEDPPGAGGPRGPQGPDNALQGVSLGSGFLISDDGYILTNHHVVEGASTITVRLSDRREFKAKLVGSDEQSDVALLKIEGKGLPALRTATDAPKPGQWVVAIGSPFGLDHSVTAGIVSAVGRSNPVANQQYVPFIQTDVAINRGNSGGPLLNTRGEVVGINSQIFSSSGGYQGVSFAIPMDLAASVVQQLRTTGHVARGQLGVQVQQLTASLANSMGLPNASGALVADVVPGSAAARAGLQRGDVIRAVNGRAVNDSGDLPPLIGALAPKSKAQLTVVREGKSLQVPVVLDALTVAAAEDAGTPNQRSAAAEPASNASLGIAVQDLTAAERKRMGLGDGEGVRIGRVDGTPARDAGLQPGDVILQVGRAAVGNSAELSRAVAALPRGQAIMLLVRRGNSTQFVAVDPSGG